MMMMMMMEAIVPLSQRTVRPCVLVLSVDSLAALLTLAHDAEAPWLPWAASRSAEKADGNTRFAPTTFWILTLLHNLAHPRVLKAKKMVLKSVSRFHRFNSDQGVTLVLPSLSPIIWIVSPLGTTFPLPGHDFVLLPLRQMKRSMHHSPSQQWHWQCPAPADGIMVLEMLRYPLKRD